MGLNDMTHTLKPQIVNEQNDSKQLGMQLHEDIR